MNFHFIALKAGSYRKNECLMLYVVLGNTEVKVNRHFSTHYFTGEDCKKVSLIMGAFGNLYSASVLLVIHWFVFLSFFYFFFTSVYDYFTYVKDMVTFLHS